MSLRPFFSFYGAKWRASKHYPAPRRDTIIEPFAGSAGYSLRHYRRNVILVEKDPFIAGTWRYLLEASPGDLLSLPDIAPHQTVDDLEVCQEAKWLIGWWLNFGSSTPKQRLSQQGINGPRADSQKYAKFWGPRVRERLANQVDKIRHWKVIEGDYRDSPDDLATWFIDPPYAQAGKHYRFSSVDYADLADFCQERSGQTIVCENVGASWLPFKPWRNIKANNTRHGGKVSREAIWLSSASE